MCCSEFQVTAGRLVNADGYGGSAIGQHVEAICDRCQHHWRVRGVVTPQPLFTNDPSLTPPPTPAAPSAADPKE